MNITTLLKTLAAMVAQFYPQQMDPSLKPGNSAGCLPCRKTGYDFIVVGAGTAGCVLANRLSANQKWKVLLIEAGGDEDYITDVPAMSSILTRSEYDWNYTTVRQQHACYNSGGICEYPAGHVMGGSSTINGMDYVRGNRQDYDEWAALGNQGWAYDAILPYFLKAENMTIPELTKALRYHSIKGAQTVAYTRFQTQISEDFVRAAVESGLQQVDYNGATQTGTAKLQFTMDGATRCSTSKAYLDPIRSRPNLYIFKNTVVRKVLINLQRRAKGVICNTKGEEYTVFAKKEVILSAGVFNSPKLLMLSGIGPKQHLQLMKIPVKSSLPVGENFIDHSGVTLYFRANKTALNCCDEYTVDTILQYARDRQGALTSPPQQALAFLNLPGKSAPGVVLFMGVINGQFTGQDEGPLVFVYVGNIKPKSRGSVKLSSNDYLDEPLVDPNYFGLQSDMAAVRYGIRQAIKYMAAPAMAKYSLQWITGAASMCKPSHGLSDEYLDCLIRYTAMAGYHGVGTVRMGSASEKSSVVDSQLRVIGVRGLRVADASIMPDIPRGNTMAPVVMIAEKAADMVLASYAQLVSTTAATAILEVAAATAAEFFILSV